VTLEITVSLPLGSSTSHRLTWLNGQPALLTLEGDAVVGATTIDAEKGRVRAVYIMRNPEKLRRALAGVGPIA
jgi:hypothetical protein